MHNEGPIKTLDASAKALSQANKEEEKRSKTRKCKTFTQSKMVV